MHGKFADAHATRALADQMLSIAKDLIAKRPA